MFAYEFAYSHANKINLQRELEITGNVSHWLVVHACHNMLLAVEDIHSIYLGMGEEIIPVLELRDYSITLDVRAEGLRTHLKTVEIKMSV